MKRSRLAALRLIDAIRGLARAALVFLSAVMWVVFVPSEEFCKFMQGVPRLIDRAMGVDEMPEEPVAEPEPQRYGILVRAREAE